MADVEFKNEISLYIDPQSKKEHYLCVEHGEPKLRGNPAWVDKGVVGGRKCEECKPPKG